MGKVIDLVAELRKDNKEARQVDLEVFANALRIYREATENVIKNGAVCSHPRTGAPIENPYLRIQAQQSGIIARMRWIQSDRLFKLMGNE